MKTRVLFSGPKNYPPAHGGVEKSIYDLARNLGSVEPFVAVEWDQPPLPNVLVLPAGLVGRARAISSFVAEHAIDVLHFNKESFIPLSIWFSLIRRKRVVLTIRGCAWRLKKWNLFIRAAFYLLDILACASLRKVIFVGRRDFDHFSRIFPWRSFDFIPNGVADHSCRATGAAGDFVFVGRISEEKNVSRMVDWFDRAGVKLAVYGPIDARNAEYGRKVLESIDASPHVTYGGVLSHTELFGVLSRYGAFINPSFSEGMPVSVLEAASVGLVLVLSDIRQHRDLGFPDAVYVSPTARELFGLEDIGGYSGGNADVAEKCYSLASTCARHEAIYGQLMRRRNGR